MREIAKRVLLDLGLLLLFLGFIAWVYHDGGFFWACIDLICPYGTYLWVPSNGMFVEWGMLILMFVLLVHDLYAMQKGFHVCWLCKKPS